MHLVTRVRQFVVSLKAGTSRREGLKEGHHAWKVVLQRRLRLRIRIRIGVVLFRELPRFFRRTEVVCACLGKATQTLKGHAATETVGAELSGRNRRAL